MNRSGVDRDRDVVDVSLRGLEGGGHLRHAVGTKNTVL